MKTEITLNQYELDKIQSLLNNFNIERSDCEMARRYRTVTLIQEGGNGIGTILEAKFDITYNGVDGVFTVTITDEGDW
jgi:hypothetical protein